MRVVVVVVEVVVVIVVMIMIGGFVVQIVVTKLETRQNRYGEICCFSFLQASTTDLVVF